VAVPGHFKVSKIVRQVISTRSTSNLVSRTYMESVIPDGVVERDSQSDSTTTVRVQNTSL